MQNINSSREDFGAVLNCAVRYAIGRKTYMPHLVIEFIRPLLKDISDKTLSCMEHDIISAKNYGDVNIDKPVWLKFLDEIQTEQVRRHNKKIKDVKS